MNAFEYASPTTTKEAIALLSARHGETEILAGGSDLLSLMKEYVVSPKRVVNIKGIKELGGINSTTSAVRVGALVTLQELHDNKTIHDDFHSLAHAAAGVASPQIRNVGTVGGDLCQRPRCWYYRNGFGLLAKDEKGRALVPAGDNRYHAIFGHPGAGPGAYYVHPSSLAPALITFAAKVRIAGPKGEREVPLESFFVVPTSDMERENVLQPNEIVTEIIIPAASRGMMTATYEVRQREALDWPLATASVALRMAGDRVKSARIVVGHVAPIPWAAAAAEKLLVGQAINEDTASKAGEAAVRSARPLSGNKYKVQLTRVAVKRALLEAAGHGKEGMQHG
jgi:xanthine dehydrogenase YagS FAD-binding subunit